MGGRRRRTTAKTVLMAVIAAVGTVVITPHQVARAATGLNELVSVNPEGEQGAGDSHDPSISADGRFIAFTTANSLVVEDTNGTDDVYVRDRFSPGTRLVSYALGGGAAGNGSSLEPSISADGRYVAFTTHATNIVAGDTNIHPDIVVRDMSDGTAVLASPAVGGGSTNQGSFEPAISADGMFVSYTSHADNLVPGDSNAASDVYVWSRAAGTVERVSVETGGSQIGGHSTSGRINADGRFVVFQTAISVAPFDLNGLLDVYVHDRLLDATLPVSEVSGSMKTGVDPKISGSGRYIAFSSGADGIVIDDDDENWDVFVRDMHTGDITLESRSAAGANSAGLVLYPEISLDGRFVSFMATDALVVGDTNSLQDVFVRDRWLETTVRSSISSSGSQATGASTFSSISGDGRYLAYFSYASNLAIDNNAAGDIFVHHRPVTLPLLRPSTQIATMSSSGMVSNQDASAPEISANGIWVAFASNDPNLVQGDTNNQPDVFVWNRITGKTVRVSVDSNGVQGSGWSADPSLSSDGRFVAYQTTSAFSGADTNGVSDVYMIDRDADGDGIFDESGEFEVELISQTATAVAGNGPSSEPSIADDASKVAFTSAATNLTVATDANGATDVFIRDRIAYPSPRTDLVSRAGGATAAGASLDPDIGPGGRYVAFTSHATNLVPGDTNGLADVFVSEEPGLAIVRISVSGTGAQGNGHSFHPSIARNGRHVAFASDASNLVPGDTLGVRDVFVHDRDADGDSTFDEPGAIATTRVSLTSLGTESVARSDQPQISQDGRFVTFRGLADSLVSDDGDGRDDIFVRDRDTDANGVFDGAAATTLLASRDSLGFNVVGNASDPAISGDGRFVVWLDPAAHVPEDTDADYSVYVRDLAAHPVDLVSSSFQGSGPNDDSGSTGSLDPSVSGDGRLVAFSSYASNLVPGDVNANSDVFVRDSVTGELAHVSVSSTGAFGSLGSTTPRISRDGRYVLFTSASPDLVPGDTNGSSDVFLRDLLTQVTTAVSVAGSTFGNDASVGLGVSQGGRYVLFASRATNFGQSVSDGPDWDLFVADRANGTVTPLWNGAQDDNGVTITRAAMSSDGKFVAFESTASTYAPDVNLVSDVFLVDRSAGSIRRISEGANPPDGSSVEPAISYDGDVVAYSSSSSNLVQGDTNGQPDIFVYHRPTGVTTRVSITENGGQASSSSDFPAISGNGRYVGFRTYASLVAGDTNNGPDTYVFDRFESSVELVSKSWSGRRHPIAVDTVGSGSPGLSEDGRVAAFASDGPLASNANGTRGVFVATLPPPPPGIEPDVTNLNLSVDTPVVGAGAASIPIGSIPLERIPALADAMSAAELGRVKIDSTPISSIPISSIGLEAATVDPERLNAIVLSSVPVDWTTILRGTALEGLNLNSLTLADVFADSAAKQRFLDAAKDIDLGEFGFDRNLLRGTSVVSALLGSTPISSIPTPNGEATWCEVFAKFGFDCPPLIDESRHSMLGFDIAGAPISSIPISSIPISSIPLVGPISSIPISSIPLVGPISSIPISSIPARDRVVDCSRIDCSASAAKTLKDAAQAGAIKQGATLADLAGAFGEITFGQVMIELLARSDFPWETVPVGNLQDVAGSPTIGYTLSYDFTCFNGVDIKTKAIVPPGFQYVTGSARFQYDGGAVITAPDPVRTGNTLTWNGLPGTECDEPVFDRRGEIEPYVNVKATFRMRPAVKLGTYSSTAVVVEQGVEFTRSGVAPVEVVENFEPNDTKETAKAIQADHLIVGHLSHAGDEDLFTLTLPPGRSRVNFSLSGIPAGEDFDLLIYAPEQDPLQSSPISSIPISSIPVEDDGADFHDDGAPPETLADTPISSIPLLGPISSISAERDSPIEQTQIVSSGAGGTITIRVTGYNGSYSPNPYVLRAWSHGPPPLPPSPPRVLPFDADAWNGSDEAQTTGTLPASLPADRQALFLVNQDRLSNLYGADAARDVVTNLNVLAQRPEVRGAVLSLDANQRYRQAFAAWDANPNSIVAANDLVRVANDIVAGYRGSLPQLKYLVVVGDDETIPFARVPDMTTLSNEIDEAADLAFTTENLTKSNASYGTAAQGMILTDDAYAAFTRTVWLGRELFLPDISVSRLLATPQEILAQIRSYTAANGLVDPQTALLTGYDFLSDGTDEIGEHLNAKVGSLNVTKLNDDHWTREDLLAHLVDRQPKHDIASVNAHYSHRLMQPAGARNEAGLVSTSDIPEPPSNPLAPSPYANRIMFTVGCHSGFNLPNVHIKNPTAAERALLLDWAERWASHGVAAYIANTGFGYGDTQEAALSERLAILFAKNMNNESLTLGEMLVLAKHEYFRTAGKYGVYDEKALIELTMYGLPFWRTGAAPAPPGHTPPATSPDPVTGLQTATITMTPALTPNSHPERGTYYEGPDGVHTMHYRPVLPLDVENVTVPGTSPHGAMLTSLSTREEATPDPYLFRPTIDHSDSEPEIGPEDQVYPAHIVSLARSRAFGAESATLNLIAGQYRGEQASGFGLGGGNVTRLVNTATIKVSYGPANAEFEAPAIHEFHVTKTSTTTARIFGRASDASGVKRFAALYHTGGSGPWSFVELARIGSTDGWATTVTVPDADLIEVLGQAQDVNGNVGVSSNKALLHPAEVDTGGPDILIVTPAANSVVKKGAVLHADYACSDGGSGVQSCTGTSANGAPVDTSTIGLRSFTVTARDGVGNLATKTVRFLVVDGGPTPPVDTTPPRSLFSAASEYTINIPPLIVATIDGRTTDDMSGVDKVTVTYSPIVGGQAFTTTATLTCDTPRRTCTWKAAAPTAPGRYEVRATAVDRAGNAESPGPKRVITLV